MARIVIRASLGNRNYTIRSKVIETPLGEPVNVKKVNLVIKPKKGFEINADQFSSGFLPGRVQGISYTNSGKNVVASVMLNSFVVNQSVVNISLPISGVSLIIGESLRIIDQTNVDSNIFVASTTSGNQNGSNITFESNTSGYKLVLQKTFTLPDGYHFKTPPAHSIQGGENNFRIESETNKDSSGNIIRKSIRFFYKFSTDNISQAVSTIKINAASQKTTVRQFYSTSVETQVLKHKIYNIDYGKKIDKRGGIKTIKVDGIPGTKFKFVIQNSAKQIFDEETGIFSAGGRFIEGVIPRPINPSIGYGTYVTHINVPATTTANTVDVRMVTESEKVEVPGTSVIEEAVDISSTMSLELINSTLSDVQIKKVLLHSELDTASAAVVASGFTTTGLTYAVGPGVNGFNIIDWVDINPVKIHTGDTMSVFTWEVHGGMAGSELYIQINRQPKFDPSATYYQWDSKYDGDTTAVTKNWMNNGTEINTDWKIGGASGADYVLNGFYLGSSSLPAITTTVEPMGEAFAHGDGYNVYHRVKITARVLGGVFGTGNINPELNITNFLTQKTGLS